MLEIAKQNCQWLDGNVINSRGSVIPFKECIKNENVPYNRQEHD